RDKDKLQNAEILLIEEKLEEIEAPLDRFVHALHPYVAFGIMPLFALANCGVEIGDLRGRIASAISVGVILGLVVGKILGIFFATWIALKLRIAKAPEGSAMPKLFGVAAVGGIGFTVAL